MLTNIQLTSGIKVFINNFECSGTYDGLLERRPTVKINKSIIDDSLLKARHQWSKSASPVYMIEPVCTLNPQVESKDYFAESAKKILLRGDGPAPVLPPITCIEQLLSPPNAKQGFWTKLVVVWFTNSFFEQPLKDALQKSLENIPWEANAKSFDF